MSVAPRAGLSAELHTSKPQPVAAVNRHRYARAASLRGSVDANQAEIVTALQKIGADVWIVGKPVDLLVGFAGHWIAVEVKNPDGRNRMQQSQIDVRDSRQRGPFFVVRSPAEALEHVTRCVRELRTVNPTQWGDAQLHGMPRV